MVEPLDEVAVESEPLASPPASSAPDPGAPAPAPAPSVALAAHPVPLGVFLASKPHHTMDGFEAWAQLRRLEHMTMSEWRAAYQAYLESPA